MIAHSAFANDSKNACSPIPKQRTSSSIPGNPEFVSPMMSAGLRCHFLATETTASWNTYFRPLDLLGACRAPTVSGYDPPTRTASHRKAEPQFCNSASWPETQTTQPPSVANDTTGPRSAQRDSHSRHGYSTKRCAMNESTFSRRSTLNAALSTPAAEDSHQCRVDS